MWKKSGLYRLIIKYPFAVLTVAYLLTIWIRSIILLRNSVLPSIMCDEMRYMSIASSILHEGKILFQGQPVAYMYILYPLLIMPLYLLPDSVNIYRAVEIFNVICYASAMYPVYLLAKRITKREGTSLLLAIGIVLLPNAIMERHIMVECVALPMMMWSFLVLFDAFDHPQNWKKWLLLAILGFLLYELKPVYVMFSLSCVLIALLDGIIQKNKRMLFNGMGVLTILLSLYFLSKLMLKVFLSYDSSQTALFAQQTHAFSWWHITQLLEGLGKYTHYHLLAFGILPVVIPFLLAVRCRDTNGKVAAVGVLTFVFTMICVIYMFYVDEVVNHNGIPLRIHTRYNYICFPLFIMFLFDERVNKLDLKLGAGVCLAVVVAGLTVHDPSALVIGDLTYSVDNMMMAALYHFSDTWDGLKTWYPVYVTGLLGLCTAAMIKGFAKTIKKVFLAAMVLVLIVNQVCCFWVDHYGMDYTADADAKQMVQMTGKKDAIYICDDWNQLKSNTTAVCVHSRCEIPVAPYRDLINNAAENGSFDTLLPSDYENYVYSKGVYPYSRPDYLILEASVLSRMVINADVPVTYSDNNLYALVPLNGEERWIHSALVTNGGWLDESSYFVVYDENILSHSQVRLQLQARRTTGAGVLTVSWGDVSFRADLTEEAAWYSFTFDIQPGQANLKVSLTGPENATWIQTYLVEGI